MRFTYRALLLILVIAAAAVSGAQVRNPIDRITQADLKADLFTLAGDAMRGREGGTVDELNASIVGKVSWPCGPPPTMKRLAFDRT